MFIETIPKNDSKPRSGRHEPLGNIMSLLRSLDLNPDRIYKHNAPIGARGTLATGRVFGGAGVGVLLRGKVGRVVNIPYELSTAAGSAGKLSAAGGGGGRAGGGGTAVVQGQL